jgi:hypothetical protein
LDLNEKQMELEAKLQRMTTLMQWWKKRAYRQRLQNKSSQNSEPQCQIKNSHKGPANYGNIYKFF